MAKNSNLKDALGSINNTKKNIIRSSGSVDVAEKMYPAFPVLRSLSYHPDCIFYTNELNAMNMAEHKLRPIMHYEFLLYSVPRRNRFSPWERETKDDKINVIKRYYKYSTEKAKEVVDLINDSTYAKIIEELDMGE